MLRDFVGRCLRLLVAQDVRPGAATGCGYPCLLTSVGGVLAGLVPEGRASSSAVPEGDGGPGRLQDSGC